MKRGLLAAGAAALAFVMLAGGGLLVLSKEKPGPVSFAGASQRVIVIMQGEEPAAELSLGPSGPALTALKPGEAAQAAQRAAEDLKLRSSLPLLVEEGGTAAFVEVGPSDPRFAHAVAAHLKASYGLDARAD